MPTGRFLQTVDALHIHADQIERYGGTPGLRDAGLLQSALAMPQTGIGDQLLHPSVFEQAAAYLFHVVKNHPFLDGNKRTGTALALVFLRLHGHDVIVESEPLVELVLAVAEGRCTKAEVAVFLSDHARPRPVG